MSEMPFWIVSGVMPCSSLYATWIARRRFVSSIARAHRRRLLVGVHDHLAADVPGGAADRLDQRGLAAQEALLVGVEDRHERDLRQVEPLAQQVHAHQHVVLAEPQLADDLDALERVDLGVQVADLEAVLEQVVGQVLGHLLRQRRDERALLDLDALADLLHQVVDLVLRLAHVDLGVHHARRAARSARRSATSGCARSRPAWPTRTRSAACAGGTRRRSAAGCRARSAAGSRTPRASVLRERSPSNMPPICGTVWCDSSMKQTKSSGKKSSRQNGRSPGARPSRMRE